MPGPTAWQQTIVTGTYGTQTITTNTETVVATLSGVNSRSPGGQIALTGYCQFAVQAATTDVKVRVRQDSLTGAVLNTQPAEFAATAATTTFEQLSIVATDTPAGEYAGKQYVLTIQATNAGANWSVTAATLAALV
jgi:hypothetical protein